MKIDITNAKNEKLFFLFLPLYRSILLWFMKFELIGNNNDIELIIKALNIKNKLKRNEFVYFTACDQMDKAVEGKNLCKFQNNKCFIQRQKHLKRNNGCCGNCSWNGPNGEGCTTANLACKIHYCKPVIEKHVLPTAKDLKILKVYNLRRQLISRTVYYESAENVLKYINNGSILYLIMRDSFLDLKHLVNK